MDTRLLLVSLLLIVVGVIRHYIPDGILPRSSFKIILPGRVIAGLGVLLVIAGLILG